MGQQGPHRRNDSGRNSATRYQVFTSWCAVMNFMRRAPSMITVRKPPSTAPPVREYLTNARLHAPHRVTLQGFRRVEATHNTPYRLLQTGAPHLYQSAWVLLGRLS